MLSGVTEFSESRRPAKAPTSPSRTPPTSTERRSVRTGPTSAPERGDRSGLRDALRRSRSRRRQPWRLDASQPERLGDGVEHLARDRSPRARFLRGERDRGRALLLGVRLAEKRRRARERLDVRLQERREDAPRRLGPPRDAGGVRGAPGSRRSAAPRQRKEERGGASRECRGPVIGGRRGPRPRGAVRPRGNRRASPKTTTTGAGAVSVAVAVGARFLFRRRSVPNEGERGAALCVDARRHAEIGEARLEAPRTQRGARAREVVPRDVSRLGGEARLRAIRSEDQRGARARNFAGARAVKIFLSRAAAAAATPRAEAHERVRRGRRGCARGERGGRERGDGEGRAGTQQARNALLETL